MYLLLFFLKHWYCLLRVASWFMIHEKENKRVYYSVNLTNNRNDNKGNRKKCFLSFFSFLFFLTDCCEKSDIQRHTSQIPHSFNSARSWQCLTRMLSGFHSLRFPKMSEWVFDFGEEIWNQLLIIEKSNRI